MNMPMTQDASISVSQADASTEAVVQPVTMHCQTDAASSQTKQAGVQLDRQQILQATRDCLAEQGYDATTIRQIAARLGCAIGSIYRYYRDKHELLSCVTGESFEHLADAVERGLPFTQAVKAYVELARRGPQCYSLMFWLANRKFDDQAVGVFHLPDAVARIIKAWGGQFKDEAGARLRWSAVHGAITSGLDPLKAIAGVSVVSSPATLETRDVDDASSHDRTAQQIVTVMRHPPLPRAMQQATQRAGASEAVAARVATVAAEDEKTLLSKAVAVSGVAEADAAAEVAVAAGQAQKEDVCLL